MTVWRKTGFSPIFGSQPARLATLRHLSACKETKTSFVPRTGKARTAEFSLRRLNYCKTNAFNPAANDNLRHKKLAAVLEFELRKTTFANMFGPTFLKSGRGAGAAPLQKKTPRQTTICIRLKNIHLHFS